MRNLGSILCVLCISCGEAGLGETKAALEVLTAEVHSTDWNTTLHAARAVQILGADVKPALPALRERLVQVRQHEGKETLAQFVRYALEGALANTR